MRGLIPDDALLLVMLGTCVLLAVALGVALYYGHVARRQAREKEQLTAILEANARQQQALAELAQAALAATDFDALCAQAVEMVAATLGVEYCKTLRLLPERRELLLTAGVGWRAGLLGTARVSAGRESQAGYTLESAAPVVVVDLGAETRFSGPALLHEHGVVSGISVVIPGPEGAWGVLGAHTRTRRQFGAREVDFFQVVAHLLGEVLARQWGEQRVAAERQKFNDILNVLPPYVVLLTPDYHVPFVNQEFRRRFGEPQGRRCYEALFGRDTPCEVCETYKVLSDGEPQHWEWTGPDGRHYDVYDHPFLDTDGTRLILEMGIDVTQRKQAEQALAERAAALERTNVELQQFAYVASHDLQEPLRMVASYTQLLARRYEGKLDTKADEFIRYASEGAMRMQALIQDLLTYSRVTTGAREAARVEPQAALERALLNLRLLVRDTQAAVSFAPMPAVMADEMQLMQLFQNLLSNAMKFHGAAAPEVHVGAEVIGNECRFCVRDNGLGIAPEHSERIFLVFQRLHSRGEYPGTGIGLAICRKIVERQGGRIWVESRPGEGSTFYFTLPLAVAATGEAHVGSFAGNAAD